MINDFQSGKGEMNTEHGIVNILLLWHLHPEYRKTFEKGKNGKCNFALAGFCGGEKGI